MFFLILDPRFKTLCLVSSLVGHEQGKAIVEKYDEKYLLPMLLKCHYHLHPLVEFERHVVDQRVEKDNNLDFIEMDAILEEEFEGAFEKDEIMDL